MESFLRVGSPETLARSAHTVRTVYAIVEGFGSHGFEYLRPRFLYESPQGPHPSALLKFTTALVREHLLAHQLTLTRVQLEFSPFIFRANPRANPYTVIVSQCKLLVPSLRCLFLSLPLLRQSSQPPLSLSVLLFLYYFLRHG
jgi:hypothetical protein